MTLTLCAVKRATEIAAIGGRAETMGNEKLEEIWMQEGPEGLRNRLAEIFSNYLTEILEIVQVSSVFWPKSLEHSEGDGYFDPFSSLGFCFCESYVLCT